MFSIGFGTITEETKPSGLSIHLLHPQRYKTYLQKCKSVLHFFIKPQNPNDHDM